MPGVVKIGVAEDMRNRLHTLSNSSLPFPFELIHFVEFENPAAAEIEIHKKLNKYRVSPNREFFGCEENVAIEALNNLNPENFSKNCSTILPKIKARNLLVPALHGRLAPRVLSVSSLIKFAYDRLEMALPETTANHNLTSLVRLGHLRNPCRGMYLNMLAEPPVVISELTPLIRAGSVISLLTVLEQHEVMKSKENHVTCVVPRTKTSKVSCKVNIDGTTFSFSSMNEAAMCEDLPHLALQPYAQAPTATPEKALLDWIYLAKHSRKWSEPPRFDLDLDRLDHDAMETLSKAMGIEAEWVEFRDRTAPVPTTPKTPFRRPR